MLVIALIAIPAILLPFFHFESKVTLEAIVHCAVTEMLDAVCLGVMLSSSKSAELPPLIVFPVAVFHEEKLYPFLSYIFALSAFLSTYLPSTLKRQVVPLLKYPAVIVSDEVVPETCDASLAPFK